MQSERVVFGVDVSKNILDYTWLPQGKAMSVANSATGIASLVKKLLVIRPEIVVLEATGGYQNDLEVALHEAGIVYAVVNPRQVRDFARSLNRLGKTDKLDALTLAEFALSRKLIPTVPKPKECKEISFLLRRREQLQDMITAEKNHLEHTPAAFRQGLLELLDTLARHLRDIDKQIRQRILANQSFAEQDKIIQSIPGIGPVTSATLLSSLPEIRFLGRKQVCALVGLAPYNRDSGNYRGQRHIFAGRAFVRKILYCTLRPCLQFNSVVKKWFNHFISLGKPYKVAAIACVRKLLVVIRAMLVSNTHWDETLHIHA